MINVRTVIVTGAGAHKHVGYPLANELKADLVRFGDQIIRDDASYHSWPVEAPEGSWDSGNIMTPNELSLIKTSADRLKTASARTLDDFLQDCDDATNAAIKKFVAAELIRREAESVEKSYNLDDDWYAAVLRKYSTKSTPTSDRLSTSEVLSIVTFNYDLYAEFRVNQTIRSDLVFTNEDRAREYIGRIRIIHPHGKLGELEGPRTYGASPADPNRYFNDLLTGFVGSPLNPEAGSANDGYEKASLAIENANRVLFVGFGYHPSVMEKLLIHDAGHYQSNYQNKFFGSFHGTQNPGEVYPFIQGDYASMVNGRVDYTSFINKYLD